MNCGASLLTSGRKQETIKKYAVLSDSRIITRRTSTPKPISDDFKPWDNFDISTDDNFVKPSEIAKDRIRSLRTHSIGESELEKAKHAFARADEVGIDETGTGVIETRMLRPSEVRELLSDWGPSEQTESSSLSETTISPSMPRVQPSEPTREKMEQSFLGSQSALTNLGYTEKKQIKSSLSQVVQPSDDFSSTLYSPTDNEHTPKSETIEEVEWELDSSELESPSDIPSESIDVYTESTPVAIICPDCGKVMHSDLYEYPNDVYSRMGNARLKQAKLFFIQGKPEKAKKAARFSRLFFEKSKDERGLIEQARLERLLGPTK